MSNPLQLLGVLIGGGFALLYFSPLLPAIAILAIYFVIIEKRNKLRDDLRNKPSEETFESLFGGSVTPTDTSKPLPSAYKVPPKDFTDIPKPPYDMYMTASEKSAHLSSQYWADLKKSCHTRDNNKCVSCQSTNYLACHHITYQRLGKELLTDVTTLCETCHQSLHNRLGYDRTTTYFPQL